MTDDETIKARYLAELERECKGTHSIDEVYVCNRIRCVRAIDLKRPCMFFLEDIKRRYIPINVPTECQYGDYSGKVIFDTAKNALTPLTPYESEW